MRLTPTNGTSWSFWSATPRKLITQQQLLSEVWGPAYAKEANYLRVYIAQLRRNWKRTPAIRATCSLRPESATVSGPEPYEGRRSGNMCSACAR